MHLLRLVRSRIMTDAVVIGASILLAASALAFAALRAVALALEAELERAKARAESAATLKAEEALALAAQAIGKADAVDAKMASFKDRLSRFELARGGRS